MRRQVTQETTTTEVATMAVCHRMCDDHHEHLEEEERRTTMVTTIGEKAQGEGCHYDTMTASTIMVTTMQDRPQERFERKRTTTSSDYIIRLTDRLLRCGTKIISCFSHGSRAGTTTRGDNMTTRVAAVAACNGTDYNNCNVSTTATPTSSETESTTPTSTDYPITPTSCADYDTVDLINPLLQKLKGHHHQLHLLQEQQQEQEQEQVLQQQHHRHHYQSCYPKVAYHNLLCSMVLHHPFRSGYRKSATF